MMENSYLDSPIPPRSFLNILYKHKKIILGLFILIAGAISVAGFVLPPVYRATSKVLVQYEEDEDSSILFGTPLPKSNHFYDRITSELVILTSRFVLDPVITELGLDQPQDDKVLDEPAERIELHEEAFEKLASNIKAEREKDTNVLSISFEDKNPALATRIVNKVVTAYSAQRPILERDERAFEFFTTHIKKIKQELDEIGGREAAERSRRKFLEPDRQTQIFFEELGTYDQELTRVRSERISKEAKLKVIKEQLAKGSNIAIPATETSDSPSQEDYLSELEKKKLDLELRADELRSTYRDEYPALAKIIANLETVKSKIRQEVERIVGEEEANVRVLISRERALAQKMNEIAGKIADLSRDQLELNKITIGKEDLEEVYSMLVRQREEARINQSKQEHMVRVRVIEPAVKPYKPVKPNKPLYVAIGILFGVVVSLGFAFLVESLDHSLNTPEDIYATLGLPILASISEIGPSAQKDFSLSSGGNGHHENGEQILEEEKWASELQDVE